MAKFCNLFRLKFHANITKALHIHPANLQKLIGGVMSTLKNKSVLEKRINFPLFWRKKSDFSGDESARFKKVQPCHHGK